MANPLPFMANPLTRSKNENRESVIFNGFSDTPPSLPPFCARFCPTPFNIYPIGTGSASIRRTMMSASVIVSPISLSLNDKLNTEFGAVACAESSPIIALPWMNL